MRRSLITNLATNGIGVRVLASLAGHRSIAVTQKYTGVNADAMRNAVELAYLTTEKYSPLEIYSNTYIMKR